MPMAVIAGVSPLKCCRSAQWYPHHPSAYSWITSKFMLTRNLLNSLSKVCASGFFRFFFAYYSSSFLFRHRFHLPRDPLPRCAACLFRIARLPPRGKKASVSLSGCWPGRGERSNEACSTPHREENSFCDAPRRYLDEGMLQSFDPSGCSGVLPFGECFRAIIFHHATKVVQVKPGDGKLVYLLSMCRNVLNGIFEHSLVKPCSNALSLRAVPAL